MSPRPLEPIPDWLNRCAGPLLALALRHRRLTELLGVGALTAACAVSLVLQRRIGEPRDDAFCVLLPAALLLRRCSLRAAFALVSVIALVQWFVSTPQNADVAVLIAFFWITLEGDVRTVVVAALVVELGAVLASLRFTVNSERYWVGITGLAIAAGAVGLVVRERRALLASMRERASRLEFERDQEGRLGAAAERARIAREMHDIVSHNLTVVVGLADGAGYALQDRPDAARDALQAISATGRQALGDMRRLLGVLREERGPGLYEPQPGLGQLGQLLDRVRAAGVPVSATIAGDLDALPGSAQLVIYRVTQEALTNTLRHAGRPASAELVLTCLPGRIALEIVDRGPERPAPPTFAAPSPAGRGLAGMRERAGACGGEVRAGPRPEGAGWRVTLELPLGADAGASAIAGVTAGALA